MSAAEAKGEGVSPDARLLALLDQARTLMQHHHDNPPPVGTLADFMRHPDYAAPMMAAALIPARTRAGVRAKAELVRAWLEPWKRLNSPEEQLAVSLLDDVLREEGR